MLEKDLKLFDVWLLNFVGLIKDLEVHTLGSCCESWLGMVGSTEFGSLGIKILRGLALW